jgi:heme A synthase
MATKKKTSAADFSDTQKKALTAAGIDWQALLAKLGPVAVQILQIILGLVTVKSAPRKPVLAGGCDHQACAQEVLEATLFAASVAADHACQCCDEEQSPANA